MAGTTRRRRPAPSPWACPDGPLGTVELSPRILNGVKDPRVFVIAGDCLAPIGIVDGDCVLVDCANTRPRHGEIVACSLNGGLMMKAYLCERGRVALGFTENGLRKQIVVRPDDRLEIIGVFVHLVASGVRRWPVDPPGYISVPVLSPGDLKNLPYWRPDPSTGGLRRFHVDGTAYDGGRTRSIPSAATA